MGLEIEEEAAVIRKRTGISLSRRLAPFPLPPGTLSPHSMPKSESPPPRAGDPQTLVGRGEIKGSTSGLPAAESARSGRLVVKGAPTLGVYRRGARLGLAER